MFLTGATVLDDGLDFLDMLCLKFDCNMLSLNASRTHSKIDDITGVDEDHGGS